MTYDPAKHRRPFDCEPLVRAQGRRSIRLRGYDYAQPGAYFVTVCTQDREPLFGGVVGTEMVLNDAGRMIRAEWKRLPDRFPTVRLDAHVVMPNHLHGIITIVGATTRGATTRVAPTGGAPHPNAPDVGAPLVGAPPVGAPDPGAPHGGAERRATLGDVVGAFKSLTTNRYAYGVQEREWPPFNGRLWQRNYYEHIIRNEREMDAIRQYIIDNPPKWELDRDNPDAER